MTTPEEQKLEQEAKTGLSTAGAAITTEVSTWRTKLNAWFSGHPGAALALGCGLVIGFVVGYLLPHA